MAILNRTEKLIRHAATGTDAFEATVFKRLLDFFKDVDYLINDNLHYNMILYLYCNNHSGKTFERIAKEFNRSVSTLDSNRRYYQKMYLYFYNQLKAEQPAAA